MPKTENFLCCFLLRSEKRLLESAETRVCRVATNPRSHSLDAVKVLQRKEYSLIEEWAVLFDVFLNSSLALHTPPCPMQLVALDILGESLAIERCQCSDVVKLRGLRTLEFDP